MSENFAVESEIFPMMKGESRQSNLQNSIFCH